MEKPSKTYYEYDLCFHLIHSIILSSSLYVFVLSINISVLPEKVTNIWKLPDQSHSLF